MRIPLPDGSRDPRIEDPTNRWVVHLAGRAFLPLALRLGISPNPISVSGFLLGAGAAAAFWHWRDLRLATLGLLLAFAWMIADGLDGMVARATGRTSAFGRFLDGLCDHGVFLLLYLTLAASVGTAGGWALAIAAGAVHAVQSMLYEGERVRFHRRLKGEFQLPGPAPAPNPLVRAYDAVSGSLDRAAAPLDRWMGAARDPKRAGQEYGRRAVPPLRLMSLLTNNMRVIAIWLACLAGDPRLFWWWELGPLSLIAVMGIVWHRRVERRLVRTPAP